jgi:ATP-binding cassette subfamily B protein
MTLSNLVSQKKTNMIGKTIDLLSNMLAVRLFNAQKKEIKNIETWSDDCVKAEKNLDIYLIKLGLFQGMAFILLQVLCWVILLKGREIGIFTVGDFALILTLNTQIFDSVSRFLEDFSRITVTFGKLTQGLSVLLSPNTSPNPKKLLECKKGVISFHDVSFGYADRPILSKLSLSIPLGQKVGIFGPSGCGKTTLIYLLLGIYKPWSGYITIDGQNINDLSVESLYSLFSFVPQNLCLFNRPFTENISYGHNNPSYKQIKEVIEQSCLNDVAQRHFQSQDNVLNQLSGGEKQRLAIARALLKPSSVCIFDEMSSALDSRTEQKIQENILSYKEKTMIFISHRTSIFECIDRIIVINNGIIMEDGSHQDLMSRESLYRSLVGLL